MKTKSNTTVAETAIVYREQTLDDAGKERIREATAYLDDDDREDLVARARRVAYDEPRYVDEADLFASPKVSVKVQDAMDSALVHIQANHGPMPVADLKAKLTAEGCSGRTVELTLSALAKKGVKSWKDSTGGLSGLWLIGARPHGRGLPSSRSAPPPVNPLDGME